MMGVREREREGGREGDREREREGEGNRGKKQQGSTWNNWIGVVSLERAVCMISRRSSSLHL